MSERFAVFGVSEIAVPLPDGMYFHDEGSSIPTLLPVDDVPTTIEGRSLEITARHEKRYLVNVKGMNPEEAEIRAHSIALEKHIEDFFDDVVRIGRCYTIRRDFGNGLETHIHILYLDEGSYTKLMFTRGHEEYHAMMQIPRAVEILEQKIIADRGTPIHFAKIKDEELAADCNGVHAVANRGFPIENLLDHNLSGRLDLGRLERAIYIYEQGEYGYFSFLAYQIKEAIINRK